MATDLNNIGWNYNARGEYQLALKAYEDALRIFQQLGDVQWIERVQKHIDELKRKLDNEWVPKSYTSFPGGNYFIFNKLSQFMLDLK